MYNRYFPAENGTFQKRSFPDAAPMQHPPTAACEEDTPPKHGDGLLSKLLPKRLDTGDLLLLLILLLLMQDGNEDAETLLLAVLAFLILW